MAILKEVVWWRNGTGINDINYPIAGSDRLIVNGAGQNFFKI